MICLYLFISLSCKVESNSTYLDHGTLALKETYKNMLYNVTARKIHMTENSEPTEKRSYGK